jgi:hypothetical protein
VGVQGKHVRQGHVRQRQLLQRSVKLANLKQGVAVLRLNGLHARGWHALRVLPAQPAQRQRSVKVRRARRVQRCHLHNEGEGLEQNNASAGSDKQVVLQQQRRRLLLLCATCSSSSSSWRRGSAH